MAKSRRLIPLLNLAVLFLIFTLLLAVPQSTVQAKEPFNFPSSDNETPISQSNGCPGGIAIDNGIINIDHFGEQDTDYEYWLYPDSYYNCYEEEPFMSYGGNLPNYLGDGAVTQCYPLTGTPGNWYEAIVELDLDGCAPDVEVHREIMVPSGERYFLVKYTIVNIAGYSLPDFKFFQGVDYDVASSSDDNEGGYSNDFVWEHDLGGVGTYVAFKGDRSSSHHDVNYYEDMWDDIDDANLNDADYYKGDTGVALEWDLGTIPTGGSASLTVTFAFAPSFDELFPSNIVQQPTAQPKSSPPTEIPPMKLKQSILSTNYARVTPQQTYANQPVTISTNVVNSGDDTGNYNVVLKINGQVEETKMVSVGPGGAYPVNFTVTKAQPGTYTASIDGHQMDFVILGDKTSAPSLNGGTIALILIGVLVLVVIVVLMFSFRRSA